MTRRLCLRNCAGRVPMAGLDQFSFLTSGRGSTLRPSQNLSGRGMTSRRNGVIRAPVDAPGAVVSRSDSVMGVARASLRVALCPGSSCASSGGAGRGAAGDVGEPSPLRAVPQDSGPAAPRRSPRPRGLRPWKRLEPGVLRPHRIPTRPGSRGDPHKLSTDDAAFPGTRRHRC